MRKIRIVLVAEIPDDENLDGIYARVYGRRSLFGHYDEEFPNDAESIELVPVKPISADSSDSL